MLCVCGRLYGSKKHCILLGMQKITIKRLAKHADNQATDCTSAHPRPSVWAWLCMCSCVGYAKMHTHTHILTHLLMHTSCMVSHRRRLIHRHPSSGLCSSPLSLSCCCSVWPKIFGINAINSLFSNGKLTAKRSRQPTVATQAAAAAWLGGIPTTDVATQGSNSRSMVPLKKRHISTQLDALWRFTSCAAS